MSITFQGEPLTLSGTFPEKGDKVPSFSLCTADLSEINSEQLLGSRVVLNIYPSVDTPVCAQSVKNFHDKLSKVDTKLLNVSIDLPFATSRFCEQENINDTLVGSCFRSPEFLENFGLAITDGPLKGLAARAVVIIDETGNILHSQLVSEITQEPDYSAAMEALVC